MSYLNQIITHQINQVNKLAKEVSQSSYHPLNVILKQQRPLLKNFTKAIRVNPLSVIAEIKRQSPSKGVIKQLADPIELASKYCLGGASAISVLTNSPYFDGSLMDLKAVTDYVHSSFPNVMTLRKDFILHPLQLAEAVFAGASAVLLIVSVVGRELKQLISEAERMGLEALVEVHTLAELDMALASKATLIGVNHRNLHTFEVNLDISRELISQIPPSVTTVAASGISTPLQAKQLYQLGYHAILVGEALMQHPSPTALITAMKEACHEG